MIVVRSTTLASDSKLAELRSGCSTAIVAATFSSTVRGTG